MNKPFASHISSIHDCSLIGAVTYAYARLKKPYLQQVYALLFMLGLYVALFWILCHLPESSMYRRRLDFCTVDKSVYM